MTISAPLSGTFNYQGVISSQSMNNINTSLPKAVDKTGDNATNGGGISGRVDVLNGASIQVATGGQIYCHGGGVVIDNSGSITLNAGSFNLHNSSQLTMDGTTQFIVGSTASILNAGTLNITSGGTLGINSGGTLHVKSGATATVDSGGILSLPAGSNVNAASGANVNMNAGSYLNFTGSSLISTSGSIASFSSGTTLQSAGYVTMASGGLMQINSGSTLKINSGSTWQTSAFPTFIVPQARVVIESTVGGMAGGGTWYGGAQFVYSGTVGGYWIKNLNRLHHGATLNQIFVSLAVGTAHSSGVPANRPSLSIVRYRWDNMFSGQSLSSTDPQYFPNPGTGVAYYNSGNQQYMVYTCNQNNVIDNENYIYSLIITDESGANSQINNAYGLIYLDHQNIPNLHWNT